MSGGFNHTGGRDLPSRRWIRKSNGKWVSRPWNHGERRQVHELQQTSTCKLRLVWSTS